MTEELGFSGDLEREIISLCLKDTQFFLDVHDHLDHKHFATDEASKTYAILKTYFETYHSIPNEDIVRHNASKIGIDIDSGYFKANPLNRDFLLTETIDLIRHQEMKRFVMDAFKEVDKKNPNFDDLEDKLRKVINIQPTHDLGLFYFDLDERFQRIKSQSVERTACGIPSMDRALGGGLGKKELVCVAAPPGAGKSYLLCIAGANMLCARNNILHYTLEMSEEITSLRYDSAILNKTSDEIKCDIVKAKDLLERRRKVMEENLVIKEFPTKSASVNTFRAHILKLREQRGFIPDVIIVDYGDIMKATRSFNNRYEEQGSIFQDLRGLAQELNVPIFSATQTNRGSMSKDIVTMEDLGDSFDKARIMDGLFCIVQKPEEKEDGLFRLYDAKVRNGRAGKLHGYEIDYARAQINEIGEV